jgi:hypothetical protein
MKRVLTALLGTTLAAAPAAAQKLAPWDAAYVEPLRLASLPLELADGRDLAGGAWEISVTPGYFNLWSGSWHTATIHQELGLEGEPLRPEELRILEQRHPGDDIHRFDVEGVVTELRFARGLGRGVTLTVSVPWVEIGSPHWDAISQEIHNALGWGVGGREVFAHSQTLAYVWNPEAGRAIEAWDELAGSGVGDVRVALSGALGSAWGGEHRWIAAVEAPTGDEGTIAGSGGWDLGVRWLGSWSFGRGALRGAAGYTRLDGSGSFLGAARDDTWHLAAEYRHLWGERADTLVGVRWDTSPLASFSGGEPGRPAFMFTIGARRWLSDTVFLAGVLGENLIPDGVNPDFTLQLQVGVRTGRR